MNGFVFCFHLNMLKVFQDHIFLQSHNTQTHSSWHSGVQTVICDKWLHIWEDKAIRALWGVEGAPGVQQLSALAALVVVMLLNQEGVSNRPSLLGSSKLLRSEVRASRNGSYLFGWQGSPGERGMGWGLATQNISSCEAEKQPHRLRVRNVDIARSFVRSFVRSLTTHVITSLVHSYSIQCSHYTLFAL